jgi:Glyoxalase-like domain
VGYEIDHLLVFTSIDAPEAERLIAFGLCEGPRNQHPGQGTANRRFFFDNAMLELLWVHSEEEARSPAARPLRLAERWSARATGACPFGICLRASSGEIATPPFASFEYQPSFFPPGLVAYIAQDTCLAQPMCFFIPRPHLVSAMPVQEHPPPQHALGVTEITKVAITLPVVSSPTTVIAAAACDIELARGTAYQLQVTFDNGRSGRCQQFGPELPIEFLW